MSDKDAQILDDEDRREYTQIAVDEYETLYALASQAFSVRKQLAFALIFFGVGFLAAFGIWYA